MLVLRIRGRKFETAVLIILPHYDIQNVNQVNFSCKSLTGLLIMYLLFNCQDFHFPLEVASIILPAIITTIIILAVLLLIGFVSLR